HEQPGPIPKGAHFLGTEHGRLLLQEFADFQCEACALQDRMLERVIERYKDRVQLIYRHLPLKSLHPHAEQAAIASECAHLQGRFWETKRYLFASQSRLGDLLRERTMPTIDSSDGAQFAACLEAQTTLPAVRRDLEEARRLGLRSTPSVIL